MNWSPLLISTLASSPRFLIQHPPFLHSIISSNITRSVAKTTVRPVHIQVPKQKYNQYGGGQYGWNAARTKRALVILSIGGAIGTVYYVTHLEPVPISGRTRMISLSPEAELQLGILAWQQVREQFATDILPPSSPQVRLVKRIAGPIIEQSGLAKLNWEFIVVDSKEVNAFVVPGGKVCVFTGLFKVCETEDMLAAVLAHEIGHVVARHSAEQMTSANVLMGAAYVIAWALGFDSASLPNTLLQFTVQLPKSRQLESEADHIGLLLMSKACYDPQAAARVWKKFGELEEQKGKYPQIFTYLSTHPASSKRLQDITEWMPEADAARAQSGCSVHHHDFMSSVRNFTK